MSDTPTPANDDATDGGLAQLREAARKGQHAQAENADLKRQLMFVKAGIDLESKLGQMLFRTFEGDDAEALIAEATEIGLIGKPAGKTAAELADEQARADEDARRTAAQNLAGRAPNPSAAEGPDPRHTAMEQYQVDIRSGRDRDEAATDAVGKVIGAALKGDHRVFFDAEAHAAAAAEADRVTSGRRG